MFTMLSKEVLNKMTYYELERLYTASLDFKIALEDSLLVAGFKSGPEWEKLETFNREVVKVLCSATVKAGDSEFDSFLRE